MGLLSRIWLQICLTWTLSVDLILWGAWLMQIV